MAGCSQAILGPFLGVIQNMYLDDTHKAAVLRVKGLEHR
jgi:hypothetical protein